MSAEIPLIGLYREHQRIEAALSNRESSLVLGPAGCGKTRLLLSAIESLPTKREVLYLDCADVLHDLLVAMTRGLLRGGHATLAELAAAGPNLEKWLSLQTSLHLKGLLWSALEKEPRIIVLDGIRGAGHRTFRFLQRLYYMRGVAIIGAARDTGSLGALRKLFWDPRQNVIVPALTSRDARRLLDQAIEHFQLRHANLAEFRQNVLESTHGNPGQIVAMCRLAADSKYVTAGHVKFSPLRMDALVSFSG